MAQDFIELLKERNPIEDVIEADGYKVQRGHRRYLKAPGNGGLVINTASQLYYWNSQDEHGDVITWVEKRRRTDYQGAVEWLCQRSGLQAPSWKPEDLQTRIETRQREDILTVAHGVFRRWYWRSQKAQGYAGGRGWTGRGPSADADENLQNTQELAMLGYTGEGTAAERAELEAELVGRAGIDLMDPPPIAVAILGMKGASNIRIWSAAHGIEPSQKWLEDGYIPALAWKGRLVYPHVRNGRIGYLSTRSIEGKSHYNMPVELAGPRHMYFNHVYGPTAADVVIVEGQADAISLGQWGIDAIALAGVSAGDIAEVVRRHKVVYVGLDYDEAGIKNSLHVCDVIGPMTRMLLWKTEAYPTYKNVEGEDAPVKDANDLLKAMIQNGDDAAAQGPWVRARFALSETYVEYFCSEVGTKEGAERDEAIRKAVKLIGRMEEIDRSQYRARLAKALAIGVRELDHMLKKTQEIEKKEGSGQEAIETFGGYIDGYVVEYLYNPETDTASLAWRAPDGVVQSGDRLKIEDRYFMPMEPDDNVRKGGVLFPAQLGPLKTTRELAAYLEAFVKSVYLLPTNSDARIIAYYILLTWMYDCFKAIPYLRATGEPGSGKSELMKRVALACYRRIIANGCSTPSVLFRMTETYKGTVYMDEMDLQSSDASSEAIKYLTLGAMSDGEIIRMEEVLGPDGMKRYKPVMYRTFAPKLIAMQKEFRDPAVATRCITFKVQPREVTELFAAGIGLNISTEMERNALALRNLLVRWRLEHWEPLIEIPLEFYDPEISSRLNQVTGPLLAIAKDDPELQAEIRQFLRAYYEELILTRSMTIAARVVEALWKIMLYPDLRAGMVVTENAGAKKILVGNVTRIANQIINTMNSGEEDGGDDDEKKDRKNDLQPHRIGRMLREELQLKVGERTKFGYYVFWDENRMRALAKRFGIHPDEIAEAIERANEKRTETTSAAPAAASKPAATQGTFLG